MVSVINKILLFLPVWLSPVFYGYIGAQIQTNQEILQKKMVQPMVHSIDSLTVKPDRLQIELRSDTELARWIAGKARNMLMAKNYAISEFNSEEKKSQATLVIEKVETQINYEGTKRNLILKHSRYLREIEGILSFYMINKERSIVFSYHREIHYSDTLERSEMEIIENQNLPFTIGKLSESTLMSRFIEPVIITVATIGVVYLFFSLRSGS